MAAPTTAELVRQYAQAHYIEPARRRGESHVQIQAGAVQRALGLINRTPGVCQALASQIFLRNNRLQIEGRTGPPGGQSTTVVFSYRLLEPELQPKGAERSDRSPLWDLYGIARDEFARFGGGEAYLQSERRRFRAALDRER